MTELIRYCRGIVQRGLKESLKTLYYTGEIKYGTIVGQDSFGNRYYENKAEPHGRHRWVEYGNPKNVDASLVPPEWHSWLHHISDKHGNTQDMMSFTPTYKREHFQNPTGTDAAYTPPNYLYNIEKQKEILEEEKK
ncbi:NADH dehydrogenase ubiquinone 1 alpha subcomplex subunit 12 [Cavenderia fasciculata]|uniref:NADH dehydrogenase [ubiquinone] 1 alpha subcomplex subunit 12 n=1 Tax=Cavenderia fasciculata TaxID=261658 RepID=F4Q8K6_CACFS|nr:NADH dehydrogenase ubiquinone 1 alpha subcomplex subunit 12 [Cavenderia fasciculata]EGG16106.1 NADH dehydrogenase ubiquinone 1 alpha subcomplex subunit 12 [Cavenderia fasciculata]|eukprot:XP_004352431.1 NADH dehydrogenase ubiquinone 1 alpha subcomplex subunit 12 [Cavenderia fasciculata]